MKSEKFNNMILIAAEAKKAKKGTGMNAILKLIADVGEFLDKVQEAIDAQDVSDYKNQLENFANKVEGECDVLFDMAKSAVRAIRQQSMPDVDVINQAEDVVPEAEAAPLQQEKVTKIAEDPRVLSVDELKNVVAKTPVSPSAPKVPKVS